MPVQFSADLGIDRGDLAACRALLRGGSRTFHAASLLLPTGIGEPAIALYAYCRLADDAVDLAAGSPAAAVAGLRDRLDAIYAGLPLDSPADRAFAATVARFAIPRAMPEALIEGFVWDVTGRRYETLADLNAYGARVAGSVGAMMALVMGRRAPETVSRACELGMAMQLSNIARDVGEDARAGRLYLPRQWMREAGLDPDAWLARPAFSPALGGVVLRVLEAAEDLYARSAAGIDDLPFLCRPGIRAARILYAEIGHQVAANGCDSVSRRAVVPAGRKLKVLARTLAARDRLDGAAPLPVHDAACFLVDSISEAPATPIPGNAIAWLVDLFGRLEMQDRLRQGQMPEPAYRSRPVRRSYRSASQPSRLRKVEC